MKTSLPISNHLEHQLEAQYIEKLDPKVQSVVNAVKTKFILCPISKKVQEELKNLESANDDIYSQKTQDIVDDTRQKVLSTMTLEEAIKFSEEEEANIDLLSKTIIKQYDFRRKKYIKFFWILKSSYALQRASWTYYKTYKFCF